MRLFKSSSVIFCLFLISACKNAPQVVFEENKTMLSPRERYGQLFEDVQMNAVFPDGKTFVDCIPKYPTDQILGAYNMAKLENDFELDKFVEEHFELPISYSSDFKSDFNRTVEEHINALWEVLTRKPDDQDTGTLISLPNSYIVPGGRFGEIYYWDSFFTMLGLKVANRGDMIENMLDNFAYLIDNIGFIPNGNRTYFTTRSQPPFFAAMVQLLSETKGDQGATLIKYLPQLEKEYAFWMNGKDEVSAANPSQSHVVWLEEGLSLNRYFDKGDYPREEMHKIDVEFMEASGREAKEFYADVRSACESGWDFSSRWFEDQQNITTIITNDIIPVDLNALLYNLELTLAEAYQKADQLEDAATMVQAAEKRKKAINQYCWDEELGFFRDYNFVKKAYTPVLSLAGTFPLYFKVANNEQADKCASIITSKFLKPGGVVSTLNNTGQQWDAPNGWAPLQLTTIEGLRNYEQSELANEIANRWIQLNTKVYKSTGKLVEKYNVENVSLESGGGEYPVQDGFGWTNGVLLYLINKQ